MSRDSNKPDWTLPNWVLWLFLFLSVGTGCVTFFVPIVSTTTAIHDRILPEKTTATAKPTPQLPTDERTIHTKRLQLRTELRHLSGRLARWSLGGAVLFPCLLIVGVISLVIMWRTGPPLVAALFTGVAIFVFWYTDPLQPSDSGEFSSVYAALGELPTELQTIGVRASLLGSLGPAAIILTMGLGFALAWRDARDPSELMRRWRIVRTMLYISAIGLACGVIATRARLELQLGPNPIDDVSRPLIDAATLAYGGGFSLLLVATFLPTMVVLRRSEEQLTDRAVPFASSAQRREWMSRVGLTVAIPARLLPVLAAVAPLLSSTLGPVLSQLGD